MNGTILPITAVWSNFIDVWHRAPMANYMLNSLMIAGGSTIIAMLCGIPAAYALARMKFKGQTIFLGFVIVSQMFAPVVLLIGIYKVMSILSLISTSEREPLTVGINVFLLTSKSLPANASGTGLILKNPSVPNGCSHSSSNILFHLDKNRRI